MHLIKPYVMKHVCRSILHVVTADVLKGCSMSYQSVRHWASPWWLWLSCRPTIKKPRRDQRVQQGCGSKPFPQISLRLSSGRICFEVSNYGWFFWTKKAKSKDIKDEHFQQSFHWLPQALQRLHWAPWFLRSPCLRGAQGGLSWVAYEAPDMNTYSRWCVDWRCSDFAWGRRASAVFQEHKQYWLWGAMGHYPSAHPVEAFKLDSTN